MSSESNQSPPKEEEQHYNFGSDLIEMNIRSQKAMDEHFTRFCNNFSILSNHHRDFTTEEMIGIHKFLEPMMVFDENIREYNKKHSVRAGNHFRKVRDYLKEQQRQDQIALIQNAKEGQMDAWLEHLKSESKKFKDEMEN